MKLEANACLSVQLTSGTILQQEEKENSYLK